ncbi:MAG: hypothetical protein K0S76_2136 [Herbinix sp.]|jgi:subtilisin family serine protease|nr:hypothetical protein [Herbinix sp.]
MITDERQMVNGEDYADLVIFYLNNRALLEGYRDSYIHYINEAFAVVHIPASQINMRTLNPFRYQIIPTVFVLTSEISLEASGVTNLRNIPRFDLRGSGTLIGIIDTGIDYTNPLLLKPDGTTKIVSLWDQTIDSGNSPYNTMFGTEYSSQEINLALTSENPTEIVPSTDDNGHGTMMAAVAAGNEDQQAEFAGVAPDAELIVVKLRPAKQYIKKFFIIPEDVLCYQENHIMWGVQYCINKANELNKPIVICLGIGSSQGSHTGQSSLSIFLSIYGDLPRRAVVISAGNEGNLGRHYSGTIDPSIGYNNVLLNVGENDTGFFMELWGTSPVIYSISILSPNGEYIPQISASLQLNREISFIFDFSTIYIDYIITESESGDQLILMRFENATPGVWSFNVYSQGDLITDFNIWLPMGNIISDQTYFLQPDIYTTVTAPGTAEVPITITAYNPVNKNLYVNSSRGYTRSHTVKPDLAAPGVNYIAPNNNKEFVNYSGTGVATAHTAGIIAMIYEWAEIRGNRTGLDSVGIKDYLARGAIRSPTLIYPNRDWGYGILDIFNIFNILR